jgi:hypothetical protein
MMIARDTFRKTVWYTILTSTTLVALPGVANCVERKRNAKEEYAVYSA